MHTTRTAGAIATALTIVSICPAPAFADGGSGGLQADPATGRSAPPAPRIRVTAAVTLTRSQTRSVQRRIHVHPDGRIGRRTRRAIRRYQSRHELMRTGRPNLQTLRAMTLRFAEVIAARMAREAAAAAAGGTFPIGGPWRHGGPATGFHARGGAHQGVDLFAACGTPLVAATAGTVKTRKFEARAGHYVVLTGTPSGEDQVYMHLRARSPLAVGDAVRAGTPLGAVGDTGDADGCHLHLELWTAPGWYAGGRPYDPTAALQGWAAAAGNPAQAP